MCVMRGLVALLCLCIPFVGATDVRADDESDKWFTLRQQAARLYEANAISDAEKILQHALEMTATLGNREHRLASLRELSMVYEREGKFAEARQVLEEAVQLQERLYGPEQAEPALTLNYLGVAERELKQYKQAVAAHQRALTILEGQNPADAKLLATTHLALAMAYDGLDLTNEPEEHYRKALKLSEDGRGLENIGLSRVFIRLGRLSVEHGNLHEAQRFIKRAEKVMTARNESNSAERMAYFDTRAAIAFYQGKCTEADRDWQQAAKIGEKLLGPDDPNVVTMILRRGELHMMVGEYKEASGLLQKCLQSVSACSLLTIRISQSH